MTIISDEASSPLVREALVSELEMSDLVLCIMTYGESSSPCDHCGSYASGRFPYTLLLWPLLRQFLIAVLGSSLSGLLYYVVCVVCVVCVLGVLCVLCVVVSVCVVCVF